MLLFLAHQLQNWSSIGGATDKNYGFSATVHNQRWLCTKVLKKNKFFLLFFSLIFPPFSFFSHFFFCLSLRFISLFVFSFFLSFSGSSLCSFLFLSFSHFSFLFSLSLNLHGFGKFWLWWWLILGVSFLDFGGGFLGFCGGGWWQIWVLWLGCGGWWLARDVYGWLVWWWQRLCI